MQKVFRRIEIKSRAHWCTMHNDAHYESHSVQSRSKIRVTIDALGNPLRLALTAGQRHDIIKAHDMIVDLDFERIIAPLLGLPATSQCSYLATLKYQHNLGLNT